jgi:sulfhydrogenase subunit beta (sulfur reductase)
MHYKSIKKEEWDIRLRQLLLSHTIFAITENDYGLDYELIEAPDIPRITYNKAKPATPLKTFFLPVSENVTTENKIEKTRIIIGSPNCDLEALNILDEIYLDEEFPDIFYSDKRENTVLIGTDCFTTQENCHCTTCNIMPFPSSAADLSVINLDNTIILRVITPKGADFLNNNFDVQDLTDNVTISHITTLQSRTEAALNDRNRNIPRYSETGVHVSGAGINHWERFSAKCVSCGACSAICPTCTCFLLIDKPGFEKVKQMDSCQYPGFARVAGGEDVLFELHNRFRNRYMCKYVWKPEKFIAPACTGCGRCIEACIGKINKNEILSELMMTRNAE